MHTAQSEEKLKNNSDKNVCEESNVPYFHTEYDFDNIEIWEDYTIEQNTTVHSLTNFSMQFARQPASI